MSTTNSEAQALVKKHLAAGLSKYATERHPSFDEQVEEAVGPVYREVRTLNQVVCLYPYKLKIRNLGPKGISEIVTSMNLVLGPRVKVIQVIG